LVIPIAADTCTLETIAFHPSGDLLAVGGVDWLSTGGSDGAVCIWDVRNCELYAIFNRGASALAFHPDGRWLASASLDHAIHWWDVSSKSLVRTLTGYDDVNAVVFSPDGRWLVSGGGDRTVRVTTAESGELAATYRLDTVVKALTFSPDGRYLFTGNGNTTNYQLDFARLLDECGC
jgi:WD40 repeat protein